MALSPRLEYAVVVMVVNVDLNAERRLERLVEEGDHPVRIVLLASRAGKARERRIATARMVPAMYSYQSADASSRTGVRASIHE